MISECSSRRNLGHLWTQLTSLLELMVVSFSFSSSRSDHKLALCTCIALALPLFGIACKEERLARLQIYLELLNW